MLSSLALLPTTSHSCSRTPPGRSKMERSHSHSASSTGSNIVDLRSPAGSGGEDSEGSKSTFQVGSKLDEEDEACSEGEGPEDGEDPDGGSSEVEGCYGGEVEDVAEPEEDHNVEAEGSSQSNSEGSSSSLGNDGKILACVVSPARDQKEHISEGDQER